MSESVRREEPPDLKWWATAPDQALAEQIRATASLWQILGMQRFGLVDAAPMSFKVELIRRVARRLLHLLEHRPLKTLEGHDPHEFVKGVARGIVGEPRGDSDLPPEPSEAVK